MLNVAEAKRSFSDLLGRVAYGGETIVIARRGKPIAKIVPFSEALPAKRLVEVKGWLEDEDPFFSAIDEIVSSRSGHVPRALAAKRKASKDRGK